MVILTNDRWKLVTVLALMAVIVAAPCGLAAEYFVSPSGDDNAPGTKERPFRTIHKAGNIMSAGDTTYVRKGTYRETVKPKNRGHKGWPIRFVAYPGEVVTLSGTELLTGQWTVHKGKIYKTKVSMPITQLFADSRMMIEARWPSIQFKDVMNRKKWRAFRKSKYGKIIDSELIKTGIDWTGATATFTFRRHWNAWTRKVKHQKGGDTLDYSTDLRGLAQNFEKKLVSKGLPGHYYLSDHLMALDSPGEWYFDNETMTLFFWALESKDPSTLEVAFKARDYAFDVKNRDYITIDGFHFWACTFTFRKCNHCMVNNCHLLFPSFAREITELGAIHRRTAASLLIGDYNTVKNSSLAFSANYGFTLKGSHNLVENNLVHDVCWNGASPYVGIMVSGWGVSKDALRRKSGQANIVRRNTVYNTGYACVICGRWNSIVELNHLHHGGLVSSDVSLLYTEGPWIRGTLFRYNWVHDNYARHGAIGIRGDDVTRGLTIHHNVIWNIGGRGIVVKGDENRVFNNTCLKTEEDAMHIFSRPERHIARYEYEIVDKQNEHSKIYNNCARQIRGWKCPPGGDLSNNYIGEAPMLMNLKRLDFRPKASSHLIDAGKFIPGVTEGFKGKAPDIGAYEYGGKWWVPGIIWSENKKVAHHESVRRLIW